MNQTLDNQIHTMASTDLQQLPTELVGTVFTYLPDSEVSTKAAEFDGAKQFARAQKEALTTYVQNTPEYYEWLGSHSHLESLTLRFPEATKFSYVSALTTVSRFYQLEEFSFEYAYFHHYGDVAIFATTLDSLPTLTSLNLMGLIITREDMEALIPSINNLVSLKSFNLAASPKDFETLQRLLPTFNRVEALNLSSIDIDTHNLARLIPLFDRPEHFISLDISYNGMDSSDVPNLAAFFSRCSNLKSLNIAFNSFTAADVQTLTPALRMMSHLESFECGINRSGLGSESVYADLIGSYPALKSLMLDFSCLPFGDWITFVCQRLKTSLAQTPHLESFALLGWQLTRDGFDALIPVLHQLPLKNLELTVLPDSKMFDFSQFPHLTALKLHSPNSFGYPDGGRLLECLESLPSLETLELDMAYPISYSGTQLASVLVGAPKIKSLKLKCGVLYDFDEFLRGLTSLEGLTQFSLFDYSDDDEGFDNLNHLILALAHFTNLEELGLSYNANFGGAGLEKLTSLFRSLPMLNHFHLGQRGFDNRYTQFREQLSEAFPHLYITYEQI